jgi:hypothetical protein
MPTKYVLLLCDTSGAHKPIARFVSDTPFHTVHIGDRFDDTGWNRLDGAGVLASRENPLRFTVHSIKHLIEETADGLLLSYCLNLEPFHGPPSPAWAE